jgi:hypothetical protein
MLLSAVNLLVSSFMFHTLLELTAWACYHCISYVPAMSAELWP